MSLGIAMATTEVTLDEALTSDAVSDRQVGPKNTFDFVLNNNNACSNERSNENLTWMGSINDDQFNKAQ